ncbi:MAG: preprotein translocase subunit SecA [Verrucomicrobiales bacterium]
MIGWIIKKFVGSKNQRLIKKMLPIVERINQLEQEYQSLSEEQLLEKAQGWKERLRAIEDPKLLQDEMTEVLPEAFAGTKNAARRLVGKSWMVADQPLPWNMVHFDVQLIGGMMLHHGKIAEMATGEGKTLVATLPLVLNGLSGRGAHLVTVNDYLARRDSDWMAPLYKMLGLSTGCIVHGQSPAERRKQYDCDITYGTNAEFGFDYLRDNGMASTKEQQVQRGHFFAIVDEVDSILIDEARVPLIISGPVTVSTQQYDRYKPLVEQLIRKQTTFCNRLVSDAKAKLEEGEVEEGGRLMFLTKLGQPRNKVLLRLLEDPENRRLMDKAELSFYQDGRKEALIALKDELFFTIDEKAHEADLTEQGRGFLSPNEPEAFVLPDLAEVFAGIDAQSELSEAEKAEQRSQAQVKCDAQAEKMHSISQLLRAYCLYEEDVHYVVEDNKVVIVDEFTGRKMPGRRWSDGLHQAVEAKEGVQVDRESQTLATITIQNYFRLYEKLAGMTGTAETDANEFHDIYKLDVAVIPTHRPNVRQDLNDYIYKTRREKYNAVIKEISISHSEGQPILVGTASVEASEVVSRMLKRDKIPHTVLNAKFHKQEAEIVSRAGQKGSVTISTNMAGRGTDIKLGEGVAEVGGLYVIATERHESRRVDRQLRGRCGRQGDPGKSRFYVSFEDDLMRNFGASDRMTKIMERFGLEDGQELEHPWLNKSVENAQKRVEQRNYMIRKRTLEFDDVMNKQREVVYGYRNDIINTDNPRELIYEIIEEIVPDKVQEHLETIDETPPDYPGLLSWCNNTFPLGLTEEKAGFESRSSEENAEHVVQLVKDSYERKSSHEEADAVKRLERHILLNSVDRLWQEHLYNMDALREGVYLRAYGQKDPLVEYKNEAYSVFVELMGNIKNEVLSNLFRSTTNVTAFNEFLKALPSNLLSDSLRQLRDQTASAAQGMAQGPRRPPPTVRDQPKIGRNDPCFCGSGKKFKNCCGRGA